MLALVALPSVVLLGLRSYFGEGGSFNEGGAVNFLRHLVQTKPFLPEGKAAF